MAYIFGDGFDCYATTADAVVGYWDSGAVGTYSLVAGRFAGSQAVAAASSGGTVGFAKSSGVNDAVHHIVVAFRQTLAISGSTLGLYFQLSDGVTNQVCIVFRSDGAILLTSATPGGTVLDTYTGAVTANNTWFAFEFEVVINNTTGSWAVRKNGNTSNDRALGSLNTRPGANSYANKLSIGVSTSVNNQQFDDVFWRSDAASVPWVGDIRCYTRMPASDASVQFARSPSPAQINSAIGSTVSCAANNSRYVSFVATYTGTISTSVIYANAGATANVKAAYYDNSAGNLPGNVLGSANVLVNPVTGANTLTWGTPVAVTRGTTYWLGVDQDATVVWFAGTAAGGSQATITYASFPTANPGGISSGTFSLRYTINITSTIGAEFVNEAQQDGTTSYVYDSTVNDTDFYTVATLSPQPASVVAVTTRGFIEKSDAGTRTGTVQIKSGAAAAVAAPTATLSTSFGWVWRTDTVDPNTSSTWTVSAVDAVTIGPKVIS